MRRVDPGPVGVMAGADATAVGVVASSAVLVVALAAAVRPRGHRQPPAAVAPERGDAPARTLVTRVVALVATQRRRRARPDTDALAAWCDDLSRRVRAGASLREALTEAPSVDLAWASAAAPMRRALARGATTDAALERIEVAGADARLVVTVLSTAARLGGSPAAAIDRTAAALRQRSADRADRQVQSAQARLSAHVLTVLPVAMLGVLAATDPDVRAAVAAPIGALCVVAGLLVNSVGWLWMRRVVAT